MRWLVTGGAGFLGTNLVEHLITEGNEVVVLDDLSRDGVAQNADYLRDRFGVRPNRIDVSDAAALSTFFKGHDEFHAVAHLAGQVSLLESIRFPRRDFEINALGTLNVLEHIRQNSPETCVIGMSSNKVYGDLAAIPVIETATRYETPDWPNGFDESLPIDFHGPYGCSKGVADQYLADYARTFGLRTASLRQSSVYGPHQHPRSDQGWVAHLLGEAVAGRVISLNGVGKQVRDLLHVADLAVLMVSLEAALVAGEPTQLNVGGGSSNALSILELFTWAEAQGVAPVQFTSGEVRPSDQRVFVADVSRTTALTGWRPQIGVQQGLAMLLRDLREAA